MKKKSALLALLLAGVMSFGVMASAGCKKKQAASTGNNGTITIPDDDTPKTDTPVTPTPDNPTPVDPTPVDPTPVDPTPVDPTPVDPTPVDPTPVDPTPDNPTPVDPTPVDPTPVDPTPVDPTPVDPTPVDPTPVDPDPVDPTPVDPVKETYTVKFMDGGEEVSSETVEKGKTVSAPSRTKAGHYLKGWYESETGSGSAFDFGTAITGNKTLYAVWAAVDARITYSAAQFEGATFEWGDGDIANAKVEYKLSGESGYKQVDSQLIRQIASDKARVDVVGLKGGETYDFVITPSSGNAIEVNGMAINKYDRSGYAHFKYSDGVGAYNDDGTLKDNAIVLYVTDENKNTISLSYGGVTVTGIGNILNSVGQDTGGGKTSNGGTKPNSNQGIIKKLGDANIPLVVRFIGCVSNSGLYEQGTFSASSTPKIDGLTIYDSTDHGGSVGDNGHMARIKSGKDITLEGIGEDAVIDGWGFHYMAESSSLNLGKSFEVRNLTFINTPEDAVGMEGAQEGNTITAGVERCWIHNNEFYCPHITNPTESDKSEGDGSCDFKRGQYFTCSYNYFEGCHKTNLVGSGDSSLQYNMTYHHNYWKYCKARGPLARNANIHMYNNVFIGQTDYAMDARANSFIFSEYNLFYMTKNPQTSSSGGVIKSYNDSFSSCINDMVGVVVTDKTQAVSNSCKYGSIDYSKFETNASQSYIPNGNYILQENVTEARKYVEAYCGTFKRDVKGAADITMADMSIVPDNVTPESVAVPSTVTPGKISKKVYAFTVSSRVEVTLDATGGVLVNEAGEALLKNSGSLILDAGTYVVQAMNFQPGDQTSLGTFKDFTINSITFKQGESDADIANRVVNLINAIPATVTASDGAAITAAREAYNTLTAEQKALVSNYSKLTEAEKAFADIAVTSINSKIAALPAASTADEATMRNQLAKYEEVKTLYEAIPAEKKGQVVGYDNVTAGIATLEAGLKPYDVKAAIAALPAKSDVTSADKEAVTEARTAYDALTEAQKSTVGDITKLTDAEAALAEIAAQTVIYVFNGTAPAGVSITGGSYSSKSGDAFKAPDGTEGCKPLKMESSTNVTLTLANKSNLKLKVSVSGKKIKIKDTAYTSDSDGYVTVTLEAGTYNITKGDTMNLWWIEVTGA